ncbi:restriction endonuclease subunit S [Streptomyces sp. F-1]|uniref:restriction endonuclease subunit S n=1 Tax=Streptomyces sp. F-1 TaxID=463642 RepID=UPI00085C4342|nr:restriction endonuclease subunit S [Streptomyces sp. F-1]SFY52906.1 Type-1 restriction enzyme EcoKI specificity protein [Streptomyces sp. F-1]
MSNAIRLRHLAQINPGTPAFDALQDDDELTFLPMEAVWPGSRLDMSHRRAKKAVSVGYTRFQNGDVLIPKITPTFEAGRAVLIQGLYGGVGAGTTELHVVRPGKAIDPRFLLYVVNTHNFLKLGEAEMYGVAGQQRVPDEFLRDLLVPLPSLEQQRRIADFLDAETARIDRINTKRRKQLDLLAERRTAALAQCVSSDGPDSIQHPLVGTVPHTWPVLPLRRVIPAVNVGVVVNPSTYFMENGVPFIHGFNVRSGWIDPHGMKFMSHESNEELRRSRVRSGDVLVVRAGSPGRAAVVTEEYDGANCASVLILRRGRAMLPQFLSAFINSPAGRGQVQVSQYGAAQEVISAAQMLSFVAPVPDVSEQQYRVDRLNAVLNSQDQVVSKLQRQAFLLAERRQALITAAVTGQFDVTTASGRNVTEGVTA